MLNTRGNSLAYYAIRRNCIDLLWSWLPGSQLNVISKNYNVRQKTKEICTPSTTPLFTARHLCSGYTVVNRGDTNPNPNRSKQLSESTLLLQEGTDIQEVPVAVIRESLDSCRNDATHIKPFVQLKPEEEAAFVEGFKNFHSPKEVLSMLHTIPSQEVTPVVALSIIRKLFEVENNFVFKNDGKSWVIATETTSPDTFARKAIVDGLIDIVLLGDDTSVLLDALDMLRTDRKSIATNVIRLSDDFEENEYLENRIPILPSDMFECSRYRSRLCEQILIRTTKGLLSFEQLCRAVCLIGKISILFPGEVEPGLVDKLWVGFSEKSNCINEENIVGIFEAIQYFKKSQRLVMRIAERKLLNLFWKMKTSTVANICDHLLMKDMRSDESGPYWGIVSARLLSSISRIIQMNLHELTEEQLVKVTKAFYALDYYDFAFEKALSKYMKAKCLKLSNPVTLATVMDYVKKNRIRSPSILDAVAEYLISYHSVRSSAHKITPIQLSSLLTPFGYLDHQPAQGHKFWEIVERLLAENFFDLAPKDLIESLLSCIYLQKYPLNFVNRIFSTYFLDRLHTTETDITVLQQARSNLKLLDAALTLECGPKYLGPYLPRDFTAKSLFTDGRITRMRAFLNDPFTSIFNPDSYKIETSLVLPNLPLHPLYILDILVSPKSGPITFESLESINANHQSTNTVASPKERINELHPQVALRNRFNLRNMNTDHYFPIKQSADYVAILINIPEHFASDGKSLLGPQVMRIRHLNLLGFTVVNLSLETLLTLKGTPQALIDYLNSEIKN